MLIPVACEEVTVPELGPLHLSPQVLIELSVMASIPFFSRQETASEWM